MGDKLINWTDEYIIDGATIDNQHKKLISLINRLYISFNEGKANDEIGTIIDELIDYTVFHFSTEEDLFEKINFFEKDKHFKQHQDFVEKTKYFRERFLNGEEDLSYEVMAFMRDWLQKHILHSDMKYKPFIYNG